VAKKFVIAYFMHEREKEVAEQMVSAAETTDSFVMGEMDEADIKEAEQQGLVIQTVEPPKPSAA